MKNIIIVFVLFSFYSYSQNVKPTNAIDGKYIAMTAEKGPNGLTTDKYFQLGENNGTLLLAMAACTKCFPAVFTYKEGLSKTFGKPVFGNTMGYYVLTYDDNSFVLVLPEVLKEADINYSNFYSKEAGKVKTMTKDKLEKYASKLLDMI